MFDNFFFSENPAFMRQCEKIIAERGRQQIIIWRMPILFWITNDTDASSFSVLQL